MNKQPLIHDFIEKKKDSANVIDFEYSERYDLNVVQHNGRTIPFIKLPKETNNGINLRELLTKTFVERESDEDPDEIHAVGFITKTGVDTGSDKDVNRFQLLEMLTKTAARRESDDELKAHNLLDLYTKTEQKRETDDEYIDSLLIEEDIMEFI